MGATKRQACRIVGQSSFNPRARDGRDIGASSQRAFIFSFNPRARDGRDLLLNAAAPVPGCFNPRARDGRDATISSSG